MVVIFFIVLSMDYVVVVVCVWLVFFILCKEIGFWEFEVFLWLCFWILCVYYCYFFYSYVWVWEFLCLVELGILFMLGCRGSVCIVIIGVVDGFFWFCNVWVFRCVRYVLSRSGRDSMISICFLLFVILFSFVICISLRSNDFIDFFVFFVLSYGFLDFDLVWIGYWREVFLYFGVYMLGRYWFVFFKFYLWRWWCL